MYLFFVCDDRVDRVAWLAYWGLCVAVLLGFLCFCPVGELLWLCHWALCVAVLLGFFCVAAPLGYVCGHPTGVCV